MKKKRRRKNQIKRKQTWRLDIKNRLSSIELGFFIYILVLSWSDYLSNWVKSKQTITTTTKMHPWDDSWKRNSDDDDDAVIWNLILVSFFSDILSFCLGVCVDIFLLNILWLARYFHLFSYFKYVFISCLCLIIFTDYFEKKTIEKERIDTGW